MQQIMKERDKKLYKHKLLNYLYEKNGHITFQALTAPVHDCWFPSVIAIRLYSAQCTCQQITIM
jgi:hypothetical protein